MSNGWIGGSRGERCLASPVFVRDYTVAVVGEADRVGSKESWMKPAPIESLPSLHWKERLLSGLSSMDRDKGSAVDEAEEIMYEAWEAPTRERAVALARKALEVSPDCADAYNLLAEEASKSLEEAIVLSFGKQKNAPQPSGLLRLRR